MPTHDHFLFYFFVFIKDRTTIPKTIHTFATQKKNSKVDGRSLASKFQFQAPADDESDPILL